MFQETWLCLWCCMGGPSAALLLRGHLLRSWFVPWGNTWNTHTRVLVKLAVISLRLPDISPTSSSSLWMTFVTLSSHINRQSLCLNRSTASHTWMGKKASVITLKQREGDSRRRKLGGQNSKAWGSSPPRTHTGNTHLWEISHIAFFSQNNNGHMAPVMKDKHSIQ